MKIAILLFLTAAPFFLGNAHAALLAYEGFNYTSPGVDLVGRNGGTGFSGAWSRGGFNASISANFDQRSGSLPFGGLATSGNSVRAGVRTDAISGVTRTLVSSLGAAGTKAYFSVVLMPEAVIGAGLFGGFFGLTLESPTEPEIFVGMSGNYVIEERGGANKLASGVSPVTGQAVLLVVKAEFNAGADKFTLFVNPTPGAPEPAAGLMRNSTVGSITGLTLYATGAYAIDELRVGQTFADVTPVPEPSLLTLAFLAVPLFLLRRASRRPR